MAKQDYLLWKNGSTGNYTIKDAYNTLIVTNDHVDSFFYRNLWALPIPNNVSVFLWRLANNWLPTHNNLIERNIIMQDPFHACPMCQNLEENVSHLLLFICDFAFKVWKECYNLQGARNLIGATLLTKSILYDAYMFLVGKRKSHL